MLRGVSDVVDGLVKDWYAAGDVEGQMSPRVMMTCPHCSVPHFTREDCCQAMLNLQDPGSLYCNNTESKDSTTWKMTRIQDLAPDLSLIYVRDRANFRLDSEVVLPKRKLAGAVGYGGPDNSEDVRKLIRRDCFGKEISSTDVTYTSYSSKKGIVNSRPVFEGKNALEHRKDLWVLR